MPMGASTSSVAKLIERAMRPGGIEFSARRADTLEAFLRSLEDLAPDVILSGPRFEETRVGS